ncbi:gamma-glutamyltransferase [Arenimonas caeni]|uniref:Glutathione hydrolase proenzyme n=1 Tax=Arenimonas caeni TaxID=2058085 RepID=A0A2P6M688_9GAMM|nr:gamma-glutamyltransferase [Arenimonas caeni]PRH81523.1 gamma-glutamyltransferase [Arenimonas caeni]
MIRFLLPGLLALLSPLALADAPARTATLHDAGIASANAYATDAGMEVLARGGNAFDAAIAVSATLGLVEPESSGLGGGGFMLLRTADGREVFIDARERAPLAATRDMFLDAAGNPDRDKSVNGALAAAIPGLPAGLDHLAKNYGRLPLSESLAPAIRLAREGWRFGPKNAAMLGWRRDVLARSPAAAELFLRKGEVPAEGTLMRNEDYARVLERLAADGADGFYRGPFARRLVRGVNQAGGIWSERDLASYAVVEREPLKFTHRGYQITTAPAPSSGGVALATMLKVLEGYDYPRLGKVERSHLLVEAMRRAYRDRALYLGDPDFVQAPVDMLTSDAYAAGLRASIHPAKATPSELLPGIDAQPLRPDTTHFSIVDAEGNLVAVTQTVNLPYGNALVVPGTGFLLNNEMDDFSVKAGVPNAFGLVGDDANAIAPGKRPLSSMTPTIISGRGRTAVLGTPGGSRIITMVMLGLLELMDGQGAQATAAAPRFHHQYLPDVVQAEAAAFSAGEIEALRAMGHTVESGERTWGNMQVVLWHHDSGKVEAGADPRWEGVGKGSASDASVYR